MWVCIFEFVDSLVLLPLSAVLSHLPFSKVWPNLGAGIACYVAGDTLADVDAGTDCKEAQAFWWGSTVFALATNPAMPVSTRYGGAALMWFVRAMAVPVSG